MGHPFDPQTNVIDLQVSRLQAKLTPPGALQLIQTVRGVGYRYDKTARNFLGAIHLAASMVWLA